MTPLITRYPTDTGIAGMSESVTSEGEGRLLFISGQLAIDADMKVTGDLVEQTDGCFDRIEAALAAAGGRLTDVLKLTVYLTSLQDYSAFSATRARRFDGDPPASTAVGVSELLLGALVEIDAVAFITAT